MSNYKMTQLVHTLRSLVLNERYEKDVIIKGTATVNGGITCGERVENKHSECSIADCLCAKTNHVVS